MNEAKIIRNWDNIKRRLKEHYEDLTEKDVTYIEGNEEVLFENLQKKNWNFQEGVNLFILFTHF
jgi:hypothetical protein